MTARFHEIARKYTPPFIKIRFKRKRNGKVVLSPAHACLALEEMLVPKPDTIEGLAYYLHECAHFWLRHFAPDEARSRKMRELYTGGETETTAQQEYEAEQWTIATLRREGIAVPGHVLKDMRDYVAACVKYDGDGAPHRVRKFVRQSKRRRRGGKKTGD
jgi:hypothetical protein